MGESHFPSTKIETKCVSKLHREWTRDRFFARLHHSTRELRACDSSRGRRCRVCLHTDGFRPVRIWTLKRFHEKRKKKTARAVFGFRVTHPERSQIRRRVLRSVLAEPAREHISRAMSETSASCSLVTHDASSSPFRCVERKREEEGGGGTSFLLFFQRRSGLSVCFVCVCFWLKNKKKDDTKIMSFFWWECDLKKRKKIILRQKIMSTGFVDFGWGCHFFTTTTRSIPKSVESVYFSLLFSPNMSFRFSLHKSLLLLLLLQRKKKEKPRRPIVQEHHNTAAPREEEEEEEEKEEAGSERRRDARDTPPERATLLGEDDDDDDDDFFETFVGEKKGNGKVEVLLLLRFLSKGFSSDIFLVGRRRGPRGETRRSLFLSKKKKKKKKKSRIFCPFARRLGKARCSFDRVSFLRRPKLPRAP